MAARRMHMGLALLLTVGLGLTEVSSQTVQTQQVMRDKLVRAERLLGDVVTSNWSQLDRDVAAIEALTKEPGWAVMRMPEYVQGGEAFLSALQDLKDAAARRDNQATPVAYVSLTLSCVRCHQDVARGRLGR